MRGFVFTGVLVALVGCGDAPTSNVVSGVELSEFGKRQAEQVARDMLAGTYNDADALPAANCARDLATDDQLIALLEAPRDEARSVFAALYADPQMRACIENNGINWRPFA